MKSTGVVRKVDELGRIVLPISIRQTMDINEKDSLEIFTDENKIILQKYQPSCIFCNNADNIVFFNGKRVCEASLKKIKETFLHYLGLLRHTFGAVRVFFQNPLNIF